MIEVSRFSKASLIYLALALLTPAYWSVSTKNEPNVSVLEQISENKIIVDENGIIFWASDIAAATFGYTASELKGIPSEILMPQNLKEIHKREFSKAIERAKNNQVDPDTITDKNPEGTLQLASVQTSICDGVMKNGSKRKLETRAMIRRANFGLIGIMTPTPIENISLPKINNDH